MALEDILKKIKKETDEKIKKIKEATLGEIKKIEEKYQEEITKKKKMILEQVKETAEKKIKRHQINLSLETKNLILIKKQKILNNLYQEILEEISNLNDKDYFKLILNLMKKCPEKGEIIPAKGREEITKKAILESRKKLNLSKKSLPIKGGFIFYSEILEIDNSFENLIKIIREKTEIEVTRVLFS